MESAGRLHPKIEVKPKKGNHESNRFNTNSTFSLGILDGP
jgi:hypothetical protein